MINNLTNCEINFAPDAIEQSFSLINIKKIQKEFNFIPLPFLFKLKEMILSEM